MHDYIRDLLQCPHCSGTLTWQIAVRQGERIIEGEATCAACAATYPIREGIGVFLTPDLPRNDLWEQAGSGITHYIQENPEVQRQLMDTPPEMLGPADLFFRAMMLEEHGDFAQARELEHRARSGLYTAEYLACYERALAALVERVCGTSPPIVDLASGRGVLVERMAKATDRSLPIIASDFSPRILRRDRRWLEYWGLYDRVSLLAFDARKTPFKDGAVATMTTNLGLPNVEEPARLVGELRRVVSGRLLAISTFYPEDDAANGEAIQAAHLGLMLYRAPTLSVFAAAGWRASLDDYCTGRAEPTPVGVVIEGASVDGLPVAATSIEWGVLVAQ